MNTDFSKHCRDIDKTLDKLNIDVLNYIWNMWKMTTVQTHLIKHKTTSMVQTIHDC